VHDGGAGLLLDARHEGGDALKRGDRVIVTSYDDEQGLRARWSPSTASRRCARAPAAAREAAEADEPAAKSGDDSR
jgi:hypothetical protein